MVLRTRRGSSYELEELLSGLDYEVVQGSVEKEVKALCYDTKEIMKECVFVCIKGANKDSHELAQLAVYNGATVLVVEHTVEVAGDITIIKVKDTREALSRMAIEYFYRPANDMIMIGITGTKGKTTTAYMIEQILLAAGMKVGVIGSIEVRYGNVIRSNYNTTPESYRLQSILYDMRSAGIKVVVMEVSSQGLKLSRVAGIKFDYGVFTNLSRDHIGGNEHEDMEEYIQCKHKLFLQSRNGIFNKDDMSVDRMMEGNTCLTVGSFGIDEAITSFGVEQICAKQVETAMVDGTPGVTFIAEINSGVTPVRRQEFAMKLPGRFSVYNALAAIEVCDNVLFQDEPATRLALMSEVLLNFSVKGRSEVINSGKGYSIVVDYAHNEMSLHSLLESLREYVTGRLICLFGCGGNRSKERRYEMGEVSAKMADVTIVTSDNPRFEKPTEIMNDIEEGILRILTKHNLVEEEAIEYPVHSYVIIEDRIRAIQTVLSKAKEGDMIVIAGKGHETYQEIMGVKYPMDDSVIVNEYLSGGQNERNNSK